MNKKLVVILAFFFIFLNSIPVNAKDFKYIEIFDPKQDKVVKVIQSNPQIQDMITSWITNIEGLYKNDPPFYLIFEDENKLLSFPFNGDIDKLSKILDFKLNNN